MSDERQLVYLKWTRKAEVTEVGGLAVEVEAGDTYEDIFEKAKSGKWANFRTLEREYGDSEWTFGPFDDPADTPPDQEPVNDDDLKPAS